MSTFMNTDPKAFSGVWVFCEQRQGKMMPTTLELISEGRKLADELGVQLSGILLGDNVDGIAAELGGYGAENTGKAWFTDVSLEQVETVPVGETVLDLATPAPSKKTDAGAPKTAKERSIPLLIGAACVYMALAALLVRPKEKR